jgi:hypothetical protein
VRRTSPIERVDEVCGMRRTMMQFMEVVTGAASSCVGPARSVNSN